MTNSTTISSALLNDAKRRSKAIETLSRFRQVSDPRIMKQMAEVYRQLGQKNECQSLVKEFLERIRKEVTASPPERGSTLRPVARAFNRIEDFAQAEPLAEEVLELATKANPHSPAPSPRSTEEKVR